jgi:hypothetical protein
LQQIGYLNVSKASEIQLKSLLLLPGALHLLKEEKSEEAFRPVPYHLKVSAFSGQLLMAADASSPLGFGQ